MKPTFRINRPSNTTKGLETQRVEIALASVKEALQTLTDNPRPDTFLN